MNFSGISTSGILGRLLRFPLRLIPDSSVVRILQGPLKGKRWIAGSGTHGSWLGSYEFDKQQAFASTVLAGDVVYDVGAHVGFYTLLAAELVGPTGQVIAFEPLPRNLKFIKQHVALNNYTNVTVFGSAVSDHSGTAAFDMQPGRSFEGHLVEDGQLHVPVVVLDELTGGEMPPPRVIKMDIEGAEYAALMGASKLLATHHPIVFLATHGPQVHRLCCDFLTGLGYALQPLDGGTIEDSDELIARWGSPS